MFKQVSSAGLHGRWLLWFWDTVYRLFPPVGHWITARHFAIAIILIQAPLTRAREYHTACSSIVLVNYDTVGAMHENRTSNDHDQEIVHREFDCAIETCEGYEIRSGRGRLISGGRSWTVVTDASTEPLPSRSRR